MYLKNCVVDSSTMITSSYNGLSLGYYDMSGNKDYSTNRSISQHADEYGVILPACTNYTKDESSSLLSIYLQ